MPYTIFKVSEQEARFGADLIIIAGALVAFI
jgi:hypothetical protein